MTSAWTTPGDLAEQARRAWDDGSLLRARLDGSALFPLALRLRRPDGKSIGERFDEARRWIRALEEGSRSVRGAGYEIEWEEINHRQLGRNRIPRAVVLPTEADALFLCGQARRAARWSAIADRTLRDFPSLGGWIARRPLALVEHEADWDRVLAVLAWFGEHPRPGLYLRQLDIPRVDTKFIEARRGLLGELLDCVLPEAAIDATAIGARAFERRYGLRTKPVRVRFRLLDAAHRLGGLSDLEVPAEELARNALPARRIFITENEINFLAFPDVPDAAVVFGAGYSVDRLASATWLATREVHYFGDLDTHGFGILDRLRATLPAARSLLMDRETLLAHRAQWVEETDRLDVPLARLTDDERALYDDLRTDRLGPRVRLEQERIGFGWLVRAIERCK